jgi:hypothetical protein
MIPAETISGMGRGGKSRAVEGVNSSMIYLIYCRNFYKCTMYPHPAQQKKNSLF